VAPADFRTINGLSFVGISGSGSTGNSDGRRSAFNNFGQLAFAANFTDGTSGVFVSNRVAIPEPSSTLLGLLALACLAATPRLNRQSACVLRAWTFTVQLR
jgi:hypothetical protein